MSTSINESTYPDLVQAVNTPVEKPGDVERGPPAYPLAEDEELVVGGTRPRWVSWRIFRRHRSNDAKSCARRRRRFIAWFIISVIALSLFHFVSTAITLHKAYKTIKCVTITPSADAAGELEFTLPMAHKSSLFIHDSLTGGDSHITRDSDVSNGTVHLSLKLSHGGNVKPDQVYDGCMVQSRHGTGVALIPRDCHGARAKISSLSLRFPTSVTAPPVTFLEKSKHLSDRKLRKVIRWWKKHHNKKDD